MMKKCTPEHSAGNSYAIESKHQNPGQFNKPFRYKKSEDKTLTVILPMLLALVFLNIEVYGKPIPAGFLKNEINFQQLSQQQIPVKGRVVDSATNNPLASVSIKIEGSEIGTTTDNNGNFSLDAPANARLIVSSVGYNEQVLEVGGRKTINIFLSSSATELQQVVVTALGVKSESRKLGYSVQNMSGKELQMVKGVDVGTSLTGKISGLVVKNSTEFNATPTIELRGETPMLVIDGVPYQNMTLRDVPADDIEDISVLKGPTAAALYGSRGANGAIMITTKGGKRRGLSVNINSNSMFQMGYLTLPQVQTSYAHGLDGHISTDYVWGPKLDIGDSAIQWNPVSKQEEMMPLVSSGKDNLKNFMEFGFVTNNNISVTQSGEHGYFRAGINHIYDKGQWPNSHLNIINYTMSGEMKIADKLNIHSEMGYTYEKSPQIWGRGYGAQGYIYNILMWTGPDYDIRQYKDYWVVPGVEQNWLYQAWYDNPYMMAYEKLDGVQQNKLHAALTADYEFIKGLNLKFRTGYDFYKNEETVRSPEGINSTRGGSSGQTFSWDFSGKGMAGMNQMWGFSTSNDLLLTYNKSFGKFQTDYLAGGSITYYQDREQGAQTRNGLQIPGWYSLANAAPSTTAGIDAIMTNFGTWARQINSLYGRASLSWNRTFYVDVTGRNDWSSTQSASQRSYFYPSVSASLIMSQILKMPEFVDQWKLRGAWTQSKVSAGIYDNNKTFSSGISWGLPSSSYPSNLLGSNLLPSATRTWEVGTEGYLFKNRLHVDVAYFNKYYYDRQISASISSASGFSSSLINTTETYVRRGLEVTLDGTIIDHSKFKWHSLINYAFQHRYYVDIDPIYSANNLWTRKGERLDAYINPGFLKTPDGQIINVNGFPVQNPFDENLGYTDPNFTFGFLNNITIGDITIGLSLDGRIGGVMYDYIWNKMFDTGANIETDTQWRFDEVVDGKTNYVGPGVKVVSGDVTYDQYGQILTDTRKYAPNDVQVSYQAYEQSLNAEGWEHGMKNKSFIKLREVSIGYNFPQSVLKGSFIKSASISLTAQNLLMWTNFPFSDPDVDDENMNAPSLRLGGLNIRVGF